MTPRIPLSRFRNNLVAYVALFFALGGTAIAAKPLITRDGLLLTPDS